MNAKYNETGKLNLHVHEDASGLIHVDKAEAVIETTEDYTVKVRQPALLALVRCMPFREPSFLVRVR